MLCGYCLVAFALFSELCVIVTVNHPSRSMKKYAYLLLLLLTTATYAQTLAPLTVEKIMRDPAQWMGTSPSEIFWAEDGKNIYFKWNPDKNKADSLYTVTLRELKPLKVAPATRRALPTPTGTYNRPRTQKVYVKDGDIYWLELKTDKARQITNTVEAESNPVFNQNEQKILFTQGDDLFAWTLSTGELTQLTQFKKGKKPETKETEQDKWLKADQQRWMEVVKERSEKKKITEKYTKADQPKRPKEIYIEEKSVSNVVLSPDERYIIYQLAQIPKNSKSIQVPNYVTESGYTEPLTARQKVGMETPGQELFVLDRQRDSVFAVLLTHLPGIYDKPDYLKDYPQKAGTAKKDSASQKQTTRTVVFGRPEWSADGKYAAVVIRANDNKDRWVALLDWENHTLKSLDRYRDEAWVGGPNYTSFGWLADNQTLWFGSEADGFAHLYTMNVASGQRKALTSGKFEVSNILLSRDKKTFYFLSNQVHTGEKHLYRMPVSGGAPVKLTSGMGAFEYTLSPDEKYIALRYSSVNQPWELYLMGNKAGAKARQITQSTTAEFNSYSWRTPEVVTFKARDGAACARLYKPEATQNNGAAVLFVHGAGYLQNAHKWWSQYFREYMFHNLLADKGYTVLDIDYRGSAGYGRDWRTGIYRHMGGKDLTDYIDGAKWLAGQHGSRSKADWYLWWLLRRIYHPDGHVQEPEIFKAGAALRSVTDWAHYNHPYTSNILNEPYTDNVSFGKNYQISTIFNDSPFPSLKT